MKKGILHLLLVVAALLSISIVSASELTDDYFDIATNYFNSNNFEKSLEYLDLILNIESDNLKAKTLRDKILPPEIDTSSDSEETSKILTSLQNPQDLVIVDAPHENIENIVYDSDYYCKKGQEFYNKKDFDMAVEYFYKAIMLNGKNVQAYNNLAMAYWCKGNSAFAIKYFKKANFINRYYTQPLVNLANVYRQLGDSKKQLKYLKKAISINKNDYLAYYWLGDYYRNLSDYPSAIVNYKEVIKINPKFPQVYLSLAMCFFETEEFNYTILSLGQYREFYPDSDFAFYLMARANLALCRYNDAKEYILKAIRLKNNNEYQFELAKIYYYLEDYSSCLEIFQNLLKVSESAEYFNYVGLCNYKLKNIDIAIANLNKAIELDGLRPIYYYNLAQCYKSLGDKKNYVKYVNTATKINPINYQDFIDLSYIFYDNKNPGYAINTLNNAISRYPSVKSLYLAKLKIFEALSDNLNYNETKNEIDMRFNRYEKSKEKIKK